AQVLLDAMEATSPALMPQLEAHRSPAGADGCRPTTSALDGPLQTLLTTPSVNVKDPPALHFGDIYADLQSILTGATLTSTLLVTPAGASGSFTGEHTLSSLTLTLNAHSQTYDLVAWGAPIIDVANIPVGYDGTTLTLGEHGFTLDWPSLWLQGLSDLSIGVRVSALQMTTAPLSPTVAQLIAATLAAAVRNGKTECAAVSDLVCSIVGGTCDVTAACTTAKSTLATTLTATLAPDSGIDLDLTSGSATIAAGSDLNIATLSDGVWTSPSLAAGTFTGMRD
ncbi:MAG TPA: hypothetical protein VIA18_15030, partial [Polyangia bacterium]|nr:hypothetical protein [Polyangia bacterium]